MSERNDGGPAFPVEIGSDGEGLQTGPSSAMVTGLTLRDYFAAKAMQGIISAKGNDDGLDYDEDVVAGYSYEMADAMIAEREKDNE